MMENPMSTAQKYYKFPRTYHFPWSENYDKYVAKFVRKSHVHKTSNNWMCQTPQAKATGLVPDRRRRSKRMGF